MNGRYASRLRGRGLDFEELREYLPSDDVRSIDWKVTARAGKPYVRVFTEERDKPALIVLDQRISMFFGSIHNMKSVTAAEAAAIVAFRIQDHGDRVGGIVFGDTHIAEVPPKKDCPSLMRFLQAVSAANQMLKPDLDPVSSIQINQVLHAVQRIAKRDHLILFISDFAEVDARTKILMDGLSRKNDVIVGLVSDPAGQALPVSHTIVGTDSRLQAQLDLGNPETRHKLGAFTQQRLANITDWSKQMRVTVMPLTAAEDTLLQMQRLSLGIGG